MKKTAVIAFIISLLLNSCNPNKITDKIQVVGEAIDSVAIAQDTSEQETLEESYEYAKTLIVSPKLAYDVRAYGGPATEGEYCIIRRGADNKPDTVVRGERTGIIINAFTADLNSNGKEEIYVVMRKAYQGASSYVFAFEFDKKGTATALSFGDSSKMFTVNTPVAYDTIRPDADTIFVAGKQLKKCYAHNQKYSPHLLNHTWQLNENKFELIPNN